MSHNDIVLTGPPRSGTTLSCELLNEVANTVALDEPMGADIWPVADSAVRRVARRARRAAHMKPSSVEADVLRVCARIEGFYDEMRASLLAGRGALSLHHGGQVLGTKFPDATGSSGLREDVTERSFMPVDKPLDDDMVLVVKQIAGFTALLPQLSRMYRCFAVVRNPLSTLSSWQTVQAPISRGRAPRGERLDPQLLDDIEQTPDVLGRQLVILAWFFDRFAHLADDAVIRYEDIVATNGRALQVVTPNASTLDRPLEGRNKAGVYDHGAMQQLGKRLLDTDGGWWRYYDRASVEELMERM